MPTRNLLPALAVALLLVACSDDDTDTTTTTGTGGSPGTGGSGGAPGTGGSAASTGGMTGSGAMGGGGAAACTEFGLTCDTGTTTCCDYAGETGLCFAFGMGNRCTIPCPADPAMCPNNGAGCNNMTPSYCKTN